jgi:formate C-acetyltransferase
LKHFIDVKIRGNQIIGQMYASLMPAPFLSVLIDDCVIKGRDYNAGGARYNSSYIQGVGIGTIADSFAAIEQIVFAERRVSPSDFVAALDGDLAGHEELRARLVHRAPKYGNDDNRADSWMRRVFDAYFDAVDGRPAPRNGVHRIQMLPTTCHVYFGSVTGATPEGRRAGRPLSEDFAGAGADRAVRRRSSSGREDDHVCTAARCQHEVRATLLAGERVFRTWLLVRVLPWPSCSSPSRCGDAAAGQAIPRITAGSSSAAGYSDYFCDLRGASGRDHRAHRA